MTGLKKGMETEPSRVHCIMLSAHKHNTAIENQTTEHQELHITCVQKASITCVQEVGVTCVQEVGITCVQEVRVTCVQEVGIIECLEITVAASIEHDLP